jgi:hypothetical protein
MSPNVNNLSGVDVPEVFKRIDGFIFDNPMDINNKFVLKEIDIKTIKILISDLTALEGLTPKDLKRREELIFQLISMLNLYYLSKRDEIDLMKNFFLIPEKS